MPAAIPRSRPAKRVTVQVKSAADPPAHPPSASSTPSRKPRAQRRRRGRGSLDSDEEIERDELTDSGASNSSVFSDTDSDSDSDSGPAAVTQQSPVLTPSTTRSPPLHHATRVPKEPSLELPVTRSQDLLKFGSQFDGGDWSEMVADENANGSAELPVIDFEDLDGHVRESSDSRAPSPSSSIYVQDDAAAPQPSTSSQYALRSQPSRRPVGHTARQAYQQRLEADPSFVPTVGEFWGHDDRLLDKDLRSLSGWWRGRWQGRGRGGFFGRGRGRGGFVGRSFSPSVDGDGQPPKGVDIPAVERAWGHDGFEEMKRREEQVRSRSSANRGGSHTSRGALRDGHSIAFALSTAPHSRTKQPPLDRPWFAMKPEQAWTKQHDAYLHPPMPRAGSLGLRIKFPGCTIHFARVVPSPSHKPSPEVVGPVIENELFVVRLPGKTLLEPEIVEPAPPPVQGVAQLPAGQREMYDGASHLFRSALDPLESGNSTIAPIPLPTHSMSSLGLLDDSLRREFDVTVLAPSLLDVEVEHPIGPPALPPLQTMFPPAQPSPSYTSPFNYLPPGIAISQHGVPYEVATGQAVYLHQPTPPPTMYTPPSMPAAHTPQAHEMPFAPGHLHHRSTVSPNFTPSLLPTMDPRFVDPVTRVPIFAPPRQTNRIEIRSPSAAGLSNISDHPSDSKTLQRTSSLRGSVEPFKPSHRTQASVAYMRQQMEEERMQHEYTTDPPDAYGSRANYGHGEVSQPQTLDPSYYPQQQQAYYYVDQYGYYQDMGQGPMQYDMYSTSQQVPGTVFY